MRPAQVEVHVEELVVDGADPRDRYRIGDAFQNELARLVGSGPLPEALVHDAAVERADGGAIGAQQPLGPGQLGVRAARAVYRGLGG